MNVYGVETGCGYNYSLAKEANCADRISESSNEIITQTESAELSENEEFEAFKKKIWEKLDSLPWNNSVNVSIQITDSAFKRMMTDEDFKNRMMDIMSKEAFACRSPIVSSLTCINEDGYSGVTYNDYNTAKTAYKAHSKHKDSFYVKKASIKDIDDAWERSRARRQEHREYRKRKYVAEKYLKRYFEQQDELESFYDIL